jgi:hypothetical protein
VEESQSAISLGKVACLSPCVIIAVKDYCVPAILDSGSSFSFIRRDVLQQVISLRLPCRIFMTDRVFHMAAGQSHMIKQAVSLQIKIQSFS